LQCGAIRIEPWLLGAVYGSKVLGNIEIPLTVTSVTSEPRNGSKRPKHGPENGIIPKSSPKPRNYTSVTLEIAV